MALGASCTFVLNDGGNKSGSGCAALTLYNITCKRRVHRDGSYKNIGTRNRIKAMVGLTHGMKHRCWMLLGIENKCARRAEGGDRWEIEEKWRGWMVDVHHAWVSLRR